MQFSMGSSLVRSSADELSFSMSTKFSKTVMLVSWRNSTEAFTFLTFFKILSHLLLGHFLSISALFC